ncbi:hypothetical protein llap_13175 [Limosa lapponica baueri]|uniref:Uncharacterized protein n=1 Tax=Limosa lapponica baueri TaxID=1758121 RepID=A0A2I0TRT4_LIMLA|nr:hypothetical protein llap_13175 [Limosa lapponica baueri]
MILLCPPEFLMKHGTIATTNGIAPRGTGLGRNQMDKTLKSQNDMGLEGTSGDHLVQPPLPKQVLLEQVTQELVQCSYIFENKELADGSHELHLEIQDAKVERTSIIQTGYDGKIHGLRIVAHCPKLVEGYNDD